MQGILKWPLIIAAIVTVLRVVTEQAGAPDRINNLISIAFLTVLAAPVYFAVRIRRSNVARPYLTHIKTTALFAVLARLMVLPTYWLARVYSWPQSRFAGVADSPVSVGVIGIPVMTAVFWIVASTIVGGLIGAALIALMRRAAQEQPEHTHTR